MWEQSGEYSTAIDLYLQLTTQNCSDNELLQNTWEKVEQSYIIFCRIQNFKLGCVFIVIELLRPCLFTQCVDLSLKFVPERSVDIAALVCDRLANMGRYVQAGELFLSVEMVKEGLDMLMAGEAWDKARAIARSIAPRYEQYVEDAYIDYLKQTNRPDEVRPSN